MAASICFNPILSSSNYNTGNLIADLKPIIVSGSGSGNPPTFVSAPSRRIIAVGDLHGDLEKAKWALNMAGVLTSDAPYIWTGGHTVVVQLGDILDRGEDEIAILSLLRSLDMQARPHGGAVFQVNGNHETMNVERDFRYVDSGGFDECADFLEYLGDCDHNWEEAFLTWIHVSAAWKQDRRKSQNYWGPWNLVKRQRGVVARSLLFQPGGPLARELARHPVALKVDDWLFCHGGLLPHHVGYGIERMNNQVSCWMRGDHDNDAAAAPPIPFIATRGYDSVVWNRLYSRDTSDLEDYQINQASTPPYKILRSTMLFVIKLCLYPTICLHCGCQIHTILEETLQAVGAKAMVVGHTPQTQGVNCEYNCSIWRIDVGMSSGVLGSSPEVLEIKDNKPRAIKGKGDTASELQVLSYI